MSRLMYVALLICLLATVFGKDLPSPKPQSEKQHSVKEEDRTVKSGSSPTNDSSRSFPPEGDTNSLAEALQVLQRRKREIARVHRPYSSYRPLGTHRYRYPLYRKRAAYYTPEYYDENSYGSNFEDSNYFDDIEKPSLFRERERGPVPELISNAHFSSKPYHKRKNVYNLSLYGSPKNTHFNLETAPYDLNIMGKLYEFGKRSENSPIFGKQFYLSNNILGNLGPVSGRLEATHYFPGESKDKAYTDLLKSFSEEEPSLQHSMIRQKRATSSKSSTIYHDVDNSSTTSRSSPTGYSHNDIKKATDREKRAYEDSSVRVNPEEAENDFLTREYFKTIARSVGNKRKRMAFGRFEAQKRSSEIDAFLENPKMLHYIQEQIKDTEEDIAKEAENEIQKNSNRNSKSNEDVTTQALLTNSIARLNALERMREALYQLEKIQDQESIRKRGQDLLGGFSEDENKKRRKDLRGRLVLEEQMEEEKERQRSEQEDLRRKSLEEEERRKRKEQVLRNLMNGNRRDDCPILERVVINCIAITEMVADEDMVFLEPCLRHEVCYMCGSGLDVSRHECDALLSSALEAGCNDVQNVQDRSEVALDCLSAAGETYNILSDPSRYDDKGTCTFDPCVRQLIDSRSISTF